MKRAWLCLILILLAVGVSASTIGDPSPLQPPEGPQIPYNVSDVRWDISVPLYGQQGIYFYVYNETRGGVKEHHCDMDLYRNESGNLLPIHFFDIQSFCKDARAYSIAGIGSPLAGVPVPITCYYFTNEGGSLGINFFAAPDVGIMEPGNYSFDIHCGNTTRLQFANEFEVVAPIIEEIRLQNITDYGSEFAFYGKTPSARIPSMEPSVCSASLFRNASYVDRSDPAVGMIYEYELERELEVRHKDGDIEIVFNSAGLIVGIEYTLEVICSDRGSYENTFMATHTDPVRDFMKWFTFGVNGVYLSIILIVIASALVLFAFFILRVRRGGAGAR